MSTNTETHPRLVISMFDKFFKGKKQRAEKAADKRDKKPDPAPAKKSPSEQAIPADSKKRKPAAKKSHKSGDAAPAPVDTRSPEEICGITADMDNAAVKAHLAKMFRRYNRLASSLDSEARIEAERMLDQIVRVRETRQ